MKNLIKRFLIAYFLFVAVFVLQRFCFIAVYHNTINLESFSDIFSIVYHGLPLDFSVAGYLTAIPGLLFIAEAAAGGRREWMRRALLYYYEIVVLVISAVFIIDLALYDFWGFRLDMTPLFYFTSSPKDALASVSGWFIAAGVVGLLVTAMATYAAFWHFLMRPKEHANSHKLRSAIVMTLLTAALFIPIRGGFTVSTMNLSKAYFSQNQAYNHAAINPAFSLLYSATHQSNFGEQFRYMDDTQAAAIMANLKDNAPADSTKIILNTKRPDIILIILEGFSNHIIPATGGEKIAVNIDSIARNGLLFTNFYANSFRTDRALTSIISAYPAQPNTSVMKYVEKAETLPSIPKTLKCEGYDIAYYYGGDANFTNMNAYLVSCGFDKIISDKDFPIAQKTSKWGAHDDVLFERFIKDYTAEKIDRPRFRIIQTSSSHEPFDVPYHKFEEKRINAFAYTDDCVGKLVNRIKTQCNWGNTLIVMVPDHFGVYPDLTDKRQRHQVPLIFTGGALTTKGINDVYGSQIDIAATLLAQLGIDAKEFTFSKNLLNPISPHFAYISENGIFGIIDKKNGYLYNFEAESALEDSGITPGANAQAARAFIQTLYDDLDKR